MQTIILRALPEGLKLTLTDEDFNAKLEYNINTIAEASK